MSAKARTLTPAEVAESVLAAFASQDVEKMLAHAHPDCLVVFVALGEFRGIDSVRALNEEMFAAFPGFDFQVIEIVADDRRAAARWIIEATFSGEPFQGIRANGRQLKLFGLDFMEVEDGLIRRNTIYYDGASFAREIGMLPARGSRGERMMLAGFNARTKLASLLRRLAP